MAEGSINSVLEGKQYNRAEIIHSQVYEALNATFLERQSIVGAGRAYVK